MNNSSPSRRNRHSTRNKGRNDYTATWRIEAIDTEDESIPIHDRNQKKALKVVMDNNYVHGPMPAKGLEPTQQQIPTLYQFPSKWRNVDDIKAPSLSYLLANYIDAKDPYYIKMLTKFFTVQFSNCTINDDNDGQNEESKKNKPKYNDSMTSKMVRKHLRKHPKSLKHCWIGTAIYDGENVNDTSNNIYCQQSTLVMEVWLDTDNNDTNTESTNDNLQCVRLQLDESKRHKLLCKMLRVKNKHKKEIKQRKHSAINLSLIPQPPPPKGDVKKSKKPKSSQRMDQLKKMVSICVNYNWNGTCEVKYCGKKHICVSCFEKHPARICKKTCFSYNWSKCYKYCPDGKTHICAQCGDGKHPAWKCTFLHPSIVQKFYFIYKSKKIRNGYFKTQEKKEIKKDSDWIHKKRVKFRYFDNYTQQHSVVQQQKHHQQQQQHMLQHLHTFNTSLNNLQNQQMNPKMNSNNNNNNNNINNMNNHRHIRHHHNNNNHNHNNHHHHNNRNNHYGNPNNQYSHYQHNNNHYQKHHHHNKLKRRSSNSRK